MPILGPPGALSPKDWGAKVNYDAWKDLYTPDDGVVLHHGGSGDYPAAQPPYTVEKEMAQLRTWERFHIEDRGWRGLAYGWGVGQTGTIYRIRGWGSYGAHQGDIDGDGISNNQELIPLIWIASGVHHQVSPAADAAIQRIRRWILLTAPAARRLMGHQEVQPKTTACPGPGGMEYVRAHRELPSQIPDEEEEMTTADIVKRLRPADVKAICEAKTIGDRYVINPRTSNRESETRFWVELLPTPDDAQWEGFIEEVKVAGLVNSIATPTGSAGPLGVYQIALTGKATPI